MTVAELRMMLERYPDDLQVVCEQHSDFCVMEESDCRIIQGVPQSGWIMRSHGTMSAENKAKETKYLYLGG